MSEARGTAFPRFLAPRDRVLLLVTCVCAVAVYANSFPGSFFGDDVMIVAQNPMVRQFDLHAILFTDYWGSEANSGLYRPLTIFSFALNRALLGGEPWAFHAANVLLHAMASGLLGLLLTACGTGRAVAWGAALLFALHPLHAEAVNMAVGRSELLVAPLLFAALLLAVRYEADPVRYPLVGGLYLLALLAKEHAVVFLALLPVVDRFCIPAPQGGWRRQWRLYLLLLAVTLGWLALRRWGVEHHGIPPEPYDPLYAPLAFLPTMPRVLTALRLQLLYLEKLLLPHDLQAIYAGQGFLQPVESLFSPWGAWLLLLLAACSLLAWRGWRRRNAFGLALLLYIVSVVPTSNLLFATGVSFAERLSYLPSAWFCLGLTALAASCQRRIPNRVVVGAGLCLMIAFGGVTVWRNRDYRDPQQLWRADVRTDPQNPLAWLGLAVAQENEGDYRRAEESYRSALRVAPGFADGHNGYASLLYRQGRFSEALEQAGLAAANGQGVFVSACVLQARSALQLELWPQALQALERLPEFIGRRHAVFWELRGRALQGEGALEEALAAFRREAELEPERESDVGSRIAALLLRLDREGEAEMAFRAALLRRQSAEAWNGLGVTLALQARFGEAVEAFAAAVRIAPLVAEYRVNYARASRSAVVTDRERGGRR